ncbi:CrcB family protein [Glutamicibacter nicotianae]|uniref:CrcB family protein n=1 Tax=Glutamicibacter nicotianae TaxID=37929 RepID=UPI000EF8EE4A|nr:CrcB family protein [Glutamicibacter nicotianae]
MTILSTGLLGGYPTFSTVSVETARLVLDRAYFAALATSFLALMICIGAVAAGFVLGQRQL